MRGWPTLERALKQNWDTLDLDHEVQWIEGLIEREEDPNIRGWAQRLADQCFELMDADEFAGWQARHGWTGEAAA